MSGLVLVIAFERKNEFPTALDIMSYNDCKREVNKMKAAVFAFVVAVIGANGVAAQRTITNADLDKYRIQREAAQRDYRENYAQMGFPSPEELQRQLEEDRLTNERFAERLSNDRIEREKAALAAMTQEQMASGSPTVVQVPTPDYYGGYYNGTHGYGYPNYSYPTGRFGNRYFPRGLGQRFPQGYGSGGTYWPSPSSGGGRIRSTPRGARPAPRPR